MLHNIIDINSISGIQKNISGSIFGVKNIQYDESPIGAGGIGSVYRVENIDGKSQKGYLLKIIYGADFVDKTHETISLLHEKLNSHQNKTKTPIFIEFPELNGLPFLTFKAKIKESGTAITGFLMRNLSELEFDDLGADDWNRENYVANIGFEEKLFLCYQFARGVSFMHSINFIHSDLKDDSIFLNLQKPQLAIIDYDGGYNYDKQDAALTIGAITSWASTKFRDLIRIGKSSKDVSAAERLDEENWIVANGLFQILFGIHPFYFLKDTEDKTINSYLKKNTWPYINVNTKEINPQNIDFQNYIINKIEQLSQQGLKPLMDTFITTFNEGHKNTKKRATPQEWKSMLFKINTEIIGSPTIQYFDSNKKSINSKGEKVEFNWSGTFYEAVYLNEVLQEQFTYQSEIVLEDEKDITLKFVSPFGESIEKITIKANKIDPIINLFNADILKRVDLTPVVLNWDTAHSKRVTVTQIGIDFPSIGSTEVNPLEKTKYVLTAYGNFDQQVTKELKIDVESVKINSFSYKINIERGIDNIDLFWETENAVEVEISPRIGKVELNGDTFVGIIDKTDFTITAKGYFGEVTKTIETQPFPIPIIKGIFVPTPIIKMDVTIPPKTLAIPSSLHNLTNINFNSSIDFNTITPSYIELNESINKYKSADKIEKHITFPTALLNNIYKKFSKS